MKLHKDLIREILLYIEKNSEYLNDRILFRERDKSKFKNYSQDDVLYTLLKLEEANYLNIIHAESDDECNVYVNSLTWSGHQFLDNIRDDEVWRKTKEITKKFTDCSISFLANVASQVISTIIIDTLKGMNS